MILRRVCECFRLAFFALLSTQIFLFSSFCEAQDASFPRVIVTTTMRAVHLRPEDLASSLLDLSPVVSVVQTSERGCELVMHGTPPIIYPGRLRTTFDGRFTCRIDIADSLFCKISNNSQGGRTCLYCAGSGEPQVELKYCGVSADEWPGELTIEHSLRRGNNPYPFD